MLNLKAKNVAIKENISLSKESSIRDVVELMDRNREGVVVLLDDRKPVGIITERDLVPLFASGVDPGQPAIEFATKELITISEEEAILSCLGRMVSHGIRRLVVVDRDGSFLGVLTQRRILNLEEMIFMLDLKVSHLVEGKTLITTDGERTLKEALLLMKDRNIGALPVVENGSLKGIITESDVLRFFKSGIDPGNKVKDYMTTPVVTALRDEPVSSVYKKMKNRNIRRIVILNEEKVPVGIVSYRDIAGSIAIDYIQSLEKKLTAMKSLVDNMPEIVIELEDKPEGRQLISWVNAHARKVLGEGVVGKEMKILIPERSWERIYLQLKADKKVSERVITDKVVWLISGLYVEVGKSGVIQLIMKDITEDFRKAFVDPTTGVYNSRFLEEFLRKELAWAKRSFSYLSLICVDFNSAQLEALKLSANILTRSLRAYDLVARGSSTSFYVLLPGTKREDATRVMGRLEKRLEEIKLLQKNCEIVMKLFSFPEDFQEIDQVFPHIRAVCEGKSYEKET